MNVLRLIGFIGVVCLTLEHVSATKKLRQRVNALEQDVETLYLKVNEGQKTEYEAAREKLENMTIDIETSVAEKIREQKADYEAARVKLENMITDFETSVAEKIYEKVKNKTEATPVVFFNARKLKDKSPSSGETLQYTVLDQNEGDAFDSQTGIFTSPCSGVFLFSVQICTEKNVWGRVKLVVNGGEVLSVTNRNSADAYTTTSGATVQRLEVGDKVWVKQDKYDGDKYKDGSTYGWNQFSGVLLYKH